MDERSGTVRLVESRGDSEASGFVTTISRTEVEKALRADEGPVDLLLDVERVAADGNGRETSRVALGWEPQDLERLLATTSDDEIGLTFDEAELRRLLDEDVDAHGMREKLAVLTVVAGMAAAGAGPAFGSVYGGSEGGPSSTPAAVVQTPTASEISTGLGDVQAAPAASQPGRTTTPSEISTGITGKTPAAAPSEISTGIVQQPPVTPAEVTTGIVQQPTATPVAASPSQPSDWAPSPGVMALAAGTILALTAAGFALRTQRRRPAMS
ncbi:MAG: hypothetical protein WBB76_03265 [Gaiellaceae bacterium]